MTLRGKPPQKGFVMTRVWKTLVSSVVLSCSVIVGLGASCAYAEPGQTTWTTFLYQGPSTHYMVVGEVPQATELDVLSCKDGWCQVSFEGRTGYLMSEVVATGDPSKPAPGLLTQPAAAMVAEPKGPCFVVNQKGGNGGNALTYVCEK